MAWGMCAGAVMGFTCQSSFIVVGVIAAFRRLQHVAGSREALPTICALLLVCVSSDSCCRCFYPQLAVYTSIPKAPHPPALKHAVYRSNYYSKGFNVLNLNYSINHPRTPFAAYADRDIRSKYSA